MKVAFISNYFNHHQKPLCDALDKYCDDYHFISTSKISAERLALGYKELNAPYVIDIHNGGDLQCVEQIIEDADVVIVGSAPEYLLKGRKKTGRLIFRYSERPVKGVREPIKYFPRLIKWNYYNPRTANIYLLSASAYAPYEYSRFGLFRDRMLKWGYFTEVEIYPEGFESLRGLKKINSILWVARMIGLKHPEVAINIAERLRKEGYSFTMEMIGDGPLRANIEALISEKHLDNTVFLRGAMSPEDVRTEMKKSEIFLFTSDKNEGWGAVLNEAMNSGCAIIADHEIGAVPFLIRDGENGLIYRDGDIDDLYLKTKKLLDEKSLCDRLGNEAYNSVIAEWTPEIAAKRLINISEHIIAGKGCFGLYNSGPCSEARIIKDDWF